MSDKSKKVEHAADYDETLGTAMAIGQHILETPRGMILAGDAPGYSTLTVDHGDPEWRRVGMILYAPSDGGGLGRGMIAQMTPDEARRIAGSLLKLAAELDPGRPN